MHGILNYAILCILLQPLHERKCKEAHPPATLELSASSLKRNLTDVRKYFSIAWEKIIQIVAVFTSYIRGWT